MISFLPRKSGTQSLNTTRNRLAAGLMCSTALGASLIGMSAACANDATVGGVPILVGPGFNLSPIAIWVPLPAAATVVNVNTEPLSGIFNTVWVTALNAPTTVNITAGNTVTSTGGFGVGVSSLAGAITLNSAARITGLTYGAQLGLVAATTGNITSNTVGINSAGIGIATATFGTTSVTDTGTIASANTGIWTIAAGGDTTVKANIVTSTANYGILSTSTTGNNTITTTGAVSGATEGITVSSTTGSNTLTASGLITGGTYGVRAGTVAATTGNITTNTAGINSTGVGIATATFGTTSVTDTGTINSTNTGIWTIAAGGNTTVNAKNVTSTANYGIFSTSTTGNNTINTSGTIKGATNGILAVSSSGNNTLNGNGTSAVTGGVEGIYVNPTTTGNATITNFASITGARAGIWTVVGGGATSIQGNGPITGSGNWGVLSTAVTGDINIGNVTANNNIRGAIVGAEALTAGAGNVNVTNAAGRTIEGGAWGLITGTITGLATINNSGIIKTTPDTGAASSGLSNLAIWQKAGNGISNNLSGGQVIGSIATAGTAYTLNNNTGATWTPGLLNNVFAAVSDTVNNAGTINLRSGDTIFAGLETFRNQAGGVINLQYGPAATDTLTVLNFTPQAGGNINIHVEPGAANGPGDSGGQGRGDTIIVVGTANPSAATTINIASLGAAPTTLTGSIALVNTVAADVPAPAPGAKLTPSANYVLGTQDLPLFGAKLKYTLVEDGAGGVFLVWQPNVTTDTLGAFFGGKAGSPSAAAAAAGKFAGVGGLGGGPSSGVAGRIGDAAAGDAGSSSLTSPGGSQRSSTTTTSCGRKEWNVFLQGDLSQSRFKSGGNSNASGGTLGIERDLSGLLTLGCDTVIATGIFGTFGGAGTGSNSSTSQGLGAFTRISTSMGFYGAAIAMVGRTETEMSNQIFGSTAKQHSNNRAFIGTAGYVYRFNGGQTWLDARGSLGLARSNGGAFTDTVGITVDSSKDEIRSFMGTLGLHHTFTSSTTGFIRAGIRATETTNSATAFSTTISGKNRQTAGLAEIGFSSVFAPGVTFSASGFGEKSKDTRALGGNVRLAIGF
jgi:hypothetical protein